MKFAVIEYKYVAGKTHIVPLKCIKKYSPKSKQTESFLCYISPNISDEPDFNVKYSKEPFNGSVGIFKVFVLKVTDSIENAIIYQREKRLKSVPKKFRDPTNTEAEISAEQNRKRRSNAKLVRINKKAAAVKNVSYLSEALFGVPNDKGDHQYDTSTSSEEDCPSSAEALVAASVCSPVDEKGYVTEGEVCPAQQQTETSAVEQCAGDFCADELLREAIPEVSSIDVNSGDESVIIKLNVAATSSGSQIQKSQKKSAMKSQHAIDKDTYDADNATTSIVVPVIEESQNTEETGKQISFYNLGTPYETLSVLNEAGAQTIPLLADQLVRGLGENMYIIPSDQNFSGVVEAMNSASMTQTNEGWHSQSNWITGNSVQNTQCGSDVSHQARSYENLLLENNNLRKENASLTERNSALQDALVSTSKAVPAVPFEAKDGGRLYNGSIFINKIQCEVLDNTEDPQKFLNNLALAIFGSTTLKNSSVTGTVSNNYKKPAKPMLDAQRLNVIYSLMAAKTNCHCFNRSKINQILNKKIYNLNATGISRKKN